MKMRLSLIIGLVLLLCGLGLLVYEYQTGMISQPLKNQTFPVVKPAVAEPSTTNNGTQTIQATGPISGQPTEIQIPSLNIDLSVIPGYYNPNTETWTLTDNHAEYATITPEPNNVEGDTFIYGHDINSVFARLHQIESGAEAVVKTANGHSFTYQLASIKTTNPLDDSVFTYRGKPILSLQTCAGPVYQYREFFNFDLIEAS